MVLGDVMCACWNDCLLTVCFCNTFDLDLDFLLLLLHLASYVCSATNICLSCLHNMPIG